MQLKTKWIENLLRYDIMDDSWNSLVDKLQITMYSFYEESKMETWPKKSSSGAT